MLSKLYLVYSTIHEIDSYDEGRTYCELLYRQVSLLCIKCQVTSHLVLQFILTESIICQPAITSYSKKNAKIIIYLNKVLIH